MKKNRSSWLTYLFALLLCISFSSNTYAQRGGGSRGGGGGRPSVSHPSYRPSTPSRSPSRSSYSAPSHTSKSISTPSKSSSYSSASKPSSSSKVSKPSAPSHSAAPASKSTMTSSGGRNSSLFSSNSSKPSTTFTSSNTKPRPPPTPVSSSGRNASISKTISKNDLSPSEKALYERAKQGGTVFSSREQAVENFKQKYSQQYPSSFKQEPKSRPNYIPSTYSTTVPGSTARTYNIIYDTSYGGYGYWTGGSNGLGNFILYNAINDSLLRQKGYYYGPTVYSSSNFLYVTLGIVVFVIILVAICALLEKR